MDVVNRANEHNIRCRVPVDDSSGDERLHFDVNGQLKSVSLRVGGLSKVLVSRLPNLVLDLIEVATLVYAVDACVSRGGTADQNMAAKWHRVFHITMPVRELDAWTKPEISAALEETLMFLSGDRFHFTFTRSTAKPSTTRYFQFGDGGDWVPSSIVMFSGGLDSLAGVLEEIAERKNKVALISHHSSTKIANVQKNLQTEIRTRLGEGSLKHIPVKAQLGPGSNKEGTHRTRSFLFAAMGVANVVVFGLDRLKFYENGFVSLNLPPVGNVLGTRATRTTHPQTLRRFSAFFSLLLNRSLRVENPYFWRTKKDVVQRIDQLGFGNLIANTRSCADVHNLTKMYTHCGRCSQCIDRRFAVLGAGLEQFDPSDAYCVDLAMGARESATDREVALSYVRMAQMLEVATPEYLENRYSVLSAVVPYLGGAQEDSLQRITRFLNRHGSGVVEVMRELAIIATTHQLSPNTLPMLYGDLQRTNIISADQKKSGGLENGIAGRRLKLVFCDRAKNSVIDSKVEIKGAPFKLMRELANATLEGAGRGLAPEEYPLIKAAKLAETLGMSNEESLRKSVNRTRNTLKKKFASASLDAEWAENAIENLPWNGYRLNPNLCEVLIRKLA